jgi:hypothetical protein
MRKEVKQLNSAQKRYAERLKELIDESEKMEALLITPKPTTVNGGLILTPPPYFNDRESLNAWLIKIQSIIEIAFGNTSQHYNKLQNLTIKDTEKGYRIKEIKGLLIGSLDDLENGFLLGQEFLIAGEVFDSVLEEAKHLLKAGYKDPAAILGRVVIEDALKRLIRHEQLDDTKKASVLNDELKKAGRYNQAQWRQVQVWLDIGNNAAHGNFTQYSEEQVKGQIEGIERFIASEFKV